MHTTRILLGFVALGLGLTTLIAADAKEIAGIGPKGEIQKVETGFKFTEGPASDRDGNLYFSDIPNQRIHKVNKEGKVSVFREKSNKTNGIMVNAKGELVCCEMAGAIVAISADGKERRVIADKFDDKPFNAPNDLVLDKEGGVYFTDPAFGAAKPLPQGKTCVYYVSAEGKVSRLLDEHNNPNGVILSPDEKTLYVIPTGPEEMWSYPVEGPGKLGKGKVFCTLKGKDDKKGGGGDGCTIDTKGNLYVTSTIGVQVFDASGKHLGTIEFPEQPSNCAFGGADMKTLFVTARTSLYSVKMEATGHMFPGKK